MSIRDPFGRVGRRQGRNYQAFCAQMQQQQVKDQVSLAAVAKRMRRLAIRMLGGVLVLAVAVGLFLPSSRGAVVLLAAILAAWVAGNYVQAHLHLNRYGREELRPAPSGGIQRKRKDHD